MKKYSMECFECENGKYDIIKCDYDTSFFTNGILEKHTIPNVPMYVCDKCGDRCTDDIGCKYIEATISQLRESRGDLSTFRRPLRK